MTRLEKMLGENGHVSIFINGTLCYREMSLDRANVILNGLDYQVLRITATYANVYV